MAETIIAATTTEQGKQDTMDDMRRDLLGLMVKFQTLEGNVDTHTTQLNSILSNTSELIDTFKAVQGAWKVLDWIGKAAKPIGWTILTCGLIFVWAREHLK